MGKIILKEARFLCNIGVSAEERKKKQEIFVDIELFSDTKKAAKTDDLRVTINYSEVYDTIKNVVERKDCKLIETIANNIAEKILKNFNASKVIINIKKPNALADKNVKYVAVEIIREKND